MMTQVLAAILLGLLLVQSAPVRGAGGEASTIDKATSSRQKSFGNGCRAILTGKEALDFPLSGPSFRLEQRRITPAELDDLEGLLFPVLAKELNLGASAPPNYCRQYAAARAGKYHAILIHGFRQGVEKEFDWKHMLIDATDGGSSYWDAVYVVELRQFAKFKWNEGGAKHSIVFHGVA